MRYAVVWGEHCVQVELHEVQADGWVRCLVDGREVRCMISGDEADAMGVTLDDQQFWAQIDGDTVWLGEQRLRAEVVDLRTLALRRAKTAEQSGDGPQAVLAPMPGRVTACLVTAGQVVKKGEPLVVIEAMKMENELRAPKDGVISAIEAALGATVEMGAVLCLVA